MSSRILLKLSGQAVQGWHYPHSKNSFIVFRRNFLCFNVSVALCPVSGHQWEEPGSLFFTPFYQVDEIPPSFLFSRLKSLSSLSFSTYGGCSSKAQRAPSSTRAVGFVSLWLSLLQTLTLISKLDPELPELYEVTQHKSRWKKEVDSSDHSPFLPLVASCSTSPMISLCFVSLRTIAIVAGSSPTKAQVQKFMRESLFCS